MRESSPFGEDLGAAGGGIFKLLPRRRCSHKPLRKFSPAFFKRRHGSNAVGRWSSSAEDEIPISFESARKGEQVLGLAGGNHKWGFPPLKVSIPQERYTPKFCLSNVGRGAATWQRAMPSAKSRGRAVEFSNRYPRWIVLIMRREVSASIVGHLLSIAGGSFKSYRFFSPHPTRSVGGCLYCVLRFSHRKRLFKR